MNQYISAEKLKEIFVAPGHISAALFDAAAKESVQTDVVLERVLVEKGLITDENMGKAIADGLDCLFVDLRRVKISEELLNLIPEDVARFQQVVVFAKEGTEKIKIATSNPQNYEFFKLLERKAGYQTEIYYATPLGIEEALKYYKSDLKKQINDLVAKIKDNLRNEAGIVKLVNLIMEFAHYDRASDIHIEPLEESVVVRFRIDGILHKIVNYPIELHYQVASRIKIMSRLRTDEHAAAQDGRFDFRVGGARFDVRVSIIPVTGGENIVMRILSERSRRIPLESLGLSGPDLDKVNRASRKPFGMLLAAGPTGSGKTTTLYAILQILDRPEVNIMTIEDPVEYALENVRQTQVNPAKNLTFATGLRSIVRQDPNIIMVGEIRDSETADIAVNAAMTGHLLLSTLHANDTSTVFPRLIEMQVEPFLVASSINVIVAQRLVRKICEKCRVSYLLSEEELSSIKSNSFISQVMSEAFKKEDFSKLVFYKGSGCKSCGQTGYSGRIGIYEVMEITDEIKPLITAKSSANEIREKAIQLGMVPMVYDGMAKVAQGITTLEEIIRVNKD